MPCDSSDHFWTPPATAWTFLSIKTPKTFTLTHPIPDITPRPPLAPQVSLALLYPTCFIVVAKLTYLLLFLSGSAIGFFFNATTTSKTSNAFTAVCFRNQDTDSVSSSLDDYYGYFISPSEGEDAPDTDTNNDTAPDEIVLAYDYSDLADTIDYTDTETDAADDEIVLANDYADLADALDDLTLSANQPSLLPDNGSGAEPKPFEPPTFVPPAYASGGTVPQMEPSVKNQDKSQSRQTQDLKADADQLSFYLGYCAPAPVIVPAEVPEPEQRAPDQRAPLAQDRVRSVDDDDADDKIHTEGVRAAVEPFDLNKIAMEAVVKDRRALMTAAADLPAHTPAWTIYQAPETALLVPAEQSVFGFGALKVPVWMVGCGAVLVLLLSVAACAAPEK